MDALAKILYPVEKNESSLEVREGKGGREGEKDGGRGKREGEEEREGRRKGGGREEKEEEESTWFVTKTTLSSQDVLHNVM